LFCPSEVCCEKETKRDPRGSQRDQRTDEERRIEAKPAGYQSQGRTAETERHIQKDSVSAHGEAAALRRHAAHCFNPEAGIDQRVAEAGERGPGCGQSPTGCGPNQREAGRSISTQASATLAPPSWSGT
jgi:hypothetical protein